MLLKLLFACFLFISIFGHSSELDELKSRYKNATNDSLKSLACFAISDHYETILLDKSIEWSEKAIKHARLYKNQEFICVALSYSNYYYTIKGSYHKAIERSISGLKIAEKEKLMKWQASFTNKIGASYQNLEDYEHAKIWLKRSIQLHNKYFYQKIAEPIGNLGSLYINTAQYDSAIYYLNQSLDIQKKDGNRENIAITLGNLATCFTQQKKYTEAEKLLLQSYAIRIEFNDYYGITKMLMDFSWFYGEQKNYPKAIVYADSSRIMAIQYNFKEFHNQAVEQMSLLYAKTGNFTKAYEYHLETFSTWKEIHEKNSAENLNKLRTVYEFDKVEANNDILTKNGKIKDLDLKRKEAEINNQQTIIIAAVGILLILFFIVYFLVKWNKDKKKQNKLLSQQKELLQMKNEEILASIQYAKRIQAAILPQPKKVKEYLNDCFILYKPKDVVAGDFYWMEQRDGVVLFAAADCTGHGVPGAMVSVVCNNGLNRSVREHGLTDPGKILDRTREIVVEEFEKSEDDVKDGMDIALCAVFQNTLKYAGANNPLWIVRNGELIEFKADKQPIGKFDSPISYTTHTVPLEKNDCIYVFSDGFADQFGGDKGKKYLSTHLKKYLLSISNETMDKQHDLINSEFEKWKGDLDQVDDVCVMGVRV